MHRARPRSRGTPASGRRSSKSASCTSWATSPATYTSPSGHCSAHHLRSDDGVLEGGDRRRASRGCGPGGRRAPGRGPRTAGPLSTPPSCPAPQGRPRRAPRPVGRRPTVAAWATALLEVTVLGPRDVAGRRRGRGRPPAPRRRRRGLSPEPTLVSADLPRDRAAGVRAAAAQRLLDHHRRRADPAGRAGRGLPRLRRDRASSFGFLDADLEIDTEVCEHLAAALPDVPWTFHRAVDATLDPRRSWRRLLGLPGLVAVRSAGSPQGLAVGYDDLLATAAVRPADRRAADARRRAARRARARGSCGPGCGSSTSARRRGRARRTSPTSTPATSARGGCCSTARSSGRAGPVAG